MVSRVMTPSQYDTAEIGKKEGMKEKANKCEQIIYA